MIDLDLLYEKKQVFGFFAKQLSYPEKDTFHPDVFEGSLRTTDPSYELVKEYWDTMQTYSLDDIQEVYTYTLDFQKDATLFMTYVKYGDSKERGQMLARLKVLYEMFGYNMSDSELSDLLPLMCEFIYVCDWKDDPRAQQSFSMLLAVLEDGSYNLMKALEKYDSPYHPLVKGMREEFKACIIPQREVSANE